MNRFGRRLSLVSPAPPALSGTKGSEEKDPILVAAKHFVHLNRQYPDVLTELRGRHNALPSTSKEHELLVLLEDHLLLLQYVLRMTHRPKENRSMRAAHRRLFPSHPVQFHLLAQNILHSLRLAQFPMETQELCGQVLDQLAADLSSGPSVPASPAQSPAPSIYAHSACDEVETKPKKGLSRKIFGWMRS